jgi:hypothetical protein
MTAKVNQSECSRLREACINKFQGVKEDMDVVKKALIGDDMRGGLVNQVNTLSKNVEAIKGMQVATDDQRDSEKREDKQDRKDVEQVRRDDNKSRKDTVTNYKLALIGVLGAIIGIILERLLIML